MRKYKVTGIFHSGMYEYDANMAYVSLAAAQDILGNGRHITGYGVRLSDIDLTAKTQRALIDRLGVGFWVRSWQDLNRPLFSAMKLERTVMFIILTLIILVSSFTIISNLLLLTIEKGREIGILQALGATPGQIARIFLLNGFMLGGSGVGLGLVLGIFISWILKRFPFDPPSGRRLLHRPSAGAPFRSDDRKRRGVRLYPGSGFRPLSGVQSAPDGPGSGDSIWLRSFFPPRNIIKRFPQGEAEVEILHGINLDLMEGEIVAIIGPSGAGKSTLLHLLGLMEQPSSGALKIQGVEVQSLSPKERARLRNEYIGFLFQFHHLLPELNVLENVMLPQRIQGASERQAGAQAAMLLDTIGLRSHFYKKPMNLSGGEQQRVALARALMNEPALILADEPTGNLDKESGEGVLKLLWEEARRRNATAVIVTHQEDIALRADRCIRLRDGRIDLENLSQRPAGR